MTSLNALPAPAKPQASQADKLSDVPSKDIMADTDNCCVCGEGEAFEENAIVFCERCDMGVHRQCYGNPLIQNVPQGEWHCDRCQVERKHCIRQSKSEPDKLPVSGSRKRPRDVPSDVDEEEAEELNLGLPLGLSRFFQQYHTPQCVLCPSRRGALKRTTDSRWAHLSCAMWIPECFFRDGDGSDTIDIGQVAGWRWNLPCEYCKHTEGAVVECSERKCNKTFHITCGMRENVYLEYKQNNRGADVVVTYCQQHGKRWRGKRNAKSVIRAS